MKEFKSNLEQLIPFGNVELTNTNEGLAITCPDDSGVAIIPGNFSIPVKIDLTAKTDSTNIRLKCGSGQVILNWECNQNELRIHDPIIGNQYGVGDQGKIPSNEFIQISWIIDHNYMLLLVNGEVRLFSENEPYIQLKHAGISNLPEMLVSVAAAWGSVVTVKELNVTEWSHDDNSGNPIALVIPSNATLKPGELITLDSYVFPNTAQNKKVVWTADKEIVNIIDHGDGRISVEALEQGLAVVKGVTDSGQLSAVCKVKIVIPNLKTNLEHLKPVNGSWSNENNGLLGSGPGDCFILSSNVADDFTYEADLSIEHGIAAALVFRSTPNASGFYCANIDISGFVKLWRPGKDIQVTYTEIERNKTYHLKVITSGENIKVYLNGNLMADVKDDTYSNGLLGLNVFYGTGLFQNVNYTLI